jgi:DNA-directed RNA polymerase specialized sigma24 family protein
MDSMLRNYLRAADPETAQACLGALTVAAEPVIRRTVHARLSGRWEDIDDVCSEARLELLLHLRRLRSGSGGTIEDFGVYVGTLARNSCFHYFRRRRPGRNRLKNQIYFLLQEPEFRTSQTHGTTRCGFAAWPETLSTGSILDTGAFEGSRDLAELLRRVFEEAGGPIDFQALVDLVAKLWNIEPDEGPTTIESDMIAAPWPAAELSIDRRRYAERLWREVGQLPRPQRVALLLNLRDGRGNSVLSLFPLCGTASFAQIAAVLELDEVRLAEVWIELPWDDNAIANFLGCSRQQVINLRMSARKRLSNRLGDRPF